MRTSLRFNIAGASPLSLFGFGAFCLFCGIILLAALNGMLRPSKPQAATQTSTTDVAARPAVAVPLPTKVATEDMTGSVKAEAAPKVAEPPTGSELQANVVTDDAQQVRPVIGRPMRSARTAERRARRLSARIQKPLQIAALETGRRKWIITTVEAIPGPEAATMCATFKRHSVSCNYE